MQQTLKRLRDDPYFAGDFGKHFAFHSSDILLPPPETKPKGKRHKITRETRRDLHDTLEGWQHILNNDMPKTKEPLRLAQGWEFVGEREGVF